MLRLASRVSSKVNRTSLPQPPVCPGSPYKSPKAAEMDCSQQHHSIPSLCSSPKPSPSSSTRPAPEPPGHKSTSSYHSALRNAPLVDNAIVLTTAPKTANLGRGSSCGVKNQPGRPLGVTRLTELMTFKSRSSTPCALTEDTRSLGCHSLGPASAAGSSDHAVGLPDVHHGRRKHRYRNRRVEHKIHNQATLRLNAGGQLNRRVRSVPPRRT